MLPKVFFFVFASFLPLRVFAGPLKARASFTVNVGQEGFTYSPNSVDASVGDTIDFVFPGAIPHTVSSSADFNQPCVLSTKSNATNLQTPLGGGTVSLTVAVDGSQWFYCATPGHCQSGMVFAINPGPAGSPTSIENFVSLAEGRSISTSASTRTSTESKSLPSSTVVGAHSTAAAAATAGSTSDASRLFSIEGRTLGTALGAAILFSFVV
ncbi:Cupredoxin [Mrakia frigida]|uniref:cupredoxin domain-containing protein n=1 Tax=Mrakia frigida TaxID=29902 RepID=UPI003FCC1737